MPNYDYSCPEEDGGCGHKFEATQGINDKPLRKCPECGKLKLCRLFGVPLLKFNGTGWTPKHYT